MKEPQRIKLTDSPESKKVKLTPLPSDNYPEPLDDDLYPQQNHENNQQNNSQSISELDSLQRD